jgi:hypothetical protein
MERDGGGLSHILGQGGRRGRTFRHLGSGTPDAPPDRRHGVDEIHYSKGHTYLTLVHQIDLGVTRLVNNKAKVTTRKSYGLRTYRVIEVALYHSLGRLPKPEATHDFS